VIRPEHPVIKLPAYKATVLVGGASMTFSEPYMFVLAISAVLSIPLVLAIRTLLATKQHVILPILRLRITNGHALIYEPSDLQDETTSPIHARRTSW
jgi:hypothetical protein